MRTLADWLRPHVKDIEEAARAGDEDALAIIRLYEMHRAAPNDPGASSLCRTQFDEWMKKRNQPKKEEPDET